MEPKNNGHMNFYESCDLTKKVCLMFIYVGSCHIHIWSRFICVVTFVPYIQCIYEVVSKYATHPSLFYSSEVLLWSFEQDVISDSSVQHQCFIKINKNLHRYKFTYFRHQVENWKDLTHYFNFVWIIKEIISFKALKHSCWDHQELSHHSHWKV